MKKTFALLVGICVLSLVRAQEFETYENGMIYSPETMNRLHHIVDSLNLKFLSCDLQKKYLGKAQTKATKVVLKGGNLKAAYKLLKSEPSLEGFRTQFPDAVITPEVLLVRFVNTHWEEGKQVEYSQFTIDGSSASVELPYKAKRDASLSLKGTWLYEQHDASLVAFYCTNDFETAELPAEYTRMIAYADCMIDTTVAKIKENASYGYLRSIKGLETMSQAEKETLLDSLRSTMVIGGCSMDDSPRVHAKNIALVAAESTNWQIFLKAHLDIMNDRFERMSDGSYAYGRRETYIHELEALDINVLDLILGITLRVENPGEHHYYGSISRLGRSLAEYKDLKTLDNTLQEAIASSELDDFNRLLFLFLYRQRIYYSVDDDADYKAIAKETLAPYIATLPAYLRP